MSNKRLLVFGASTHSKSINKVFATYAAQQLQGVDLKIVDLNDFPLPLYSIDHEKAAGIPAAAVRFSDEITDADGLVISLAEHNGLFTAAFKNLWDWMSRNGSAKIWQDKPILLLCTSPGRRPEKYVMKVAKDLFPVFGGRIISDFYLPGYKDHFKDGEITDPDLAYNFKVAVNAFQAYLNQI
ncbi:MAG: NAD(P)H-dependent oxidoreductase [Bacteroidota bacterium]